MVTNHFIRDTSSRFWDYGGLFILNIGFQALSAAPLTNKEVHYCDIYMWLQPLVIDQAVNELSPRAKPEDKVCLPFHKSMATIAITIISYLIGRCLTSDHNLRHHDNNFSEVLCRESDETESFFHTCLTLATAGNVDVINFRTTPITCTHCLCPTLS